MKVKKILLLLCAVLISTGLWWKSRPVIHSAHQMHNESRAPNNILARDQQKLESHFDSKILTSKNWELINDYSLSAKKLVQQNDTTELFLLTQQIARDLQLCLKKDYCSMERRSEDDSYFDETRTPGHILLGRDLEIMLESLQLNPERKNQIDWEMINSLTENENEKVQVLALQMIKQFSAKGADTSELLAIAENYKGEAKAQAFEKIATRDSSSDRSALISWLEKSFSEDDPHSVISIIEKMKRMRFTESEIEKISLSLCHFRENGNDEPNWKMIRYYMSSLVDLEKICP